MQAEKAIGQRLSDDPTVSLQNIPISNAAPLISLKAGSLLIRVN